MKNDAESTRRSYWPEPAPWLREKDRERHRDLLARIGTKVVVLGAWTWIIVSALMAMGQR